MKGIIYLIGGFVISYAGISGPDAGEYPGLAAGMILFVMAIAEGVNTPNGKS